MPNDLIDLGFTSEISMRLVLSNMFKPSRNFPTDRSKAARLMWILFGICDAMHHLRETI